MNVLVNINGLANCRVFRKTSLKKKSRWFLGNEICWVITAWNSLNEWVIKLLNWIKKTSSYISSIPHDSITSLWLSLYPIRFDLAWPFLGLSHSIWLGVTLILGLSTQMSSREIDSNQLVTQAVSRRVESIQLMTQVAFQGIDSESAHDSCRSQGTDSDQLMTQTASRELIQDQLTTQADSQVLIQIAWWLKQKTFDSETTHDSTLSRTHVCNKGSWGWGPVSWPVGRAEIRTRDLSHDPNFRLKVVVQVSYCILVRQNASMTQNSFMPQFGSRYPR